MFCVGQQRCLLPDMVGKVKMTTTDRLWSVAKYRLARGVIMDCKLCIFCVNFILHASQAVSEHPQCQFNITTNHIGSEIQNLSLMLRVVVLEKIPATSIRCGHGPQ